MYLGTLWPSFFVECSSSRYCFCCRSCPPAHGNVESMGGASAILWSTARPLERQTSLLAVMHQLDMKGLYVVGCTYDALFCCRSRWLPKLGEMRSHDESAPGRTIAFTHQLGKGLLEVGLPPIAIWFLIALYSWHPSAAKGRGWLCWGASFAFQCWVVCKFKVMVISSWYYGTNWWHGVSSHSHSISGNVINIF